MLNFELYNPTKIIFGKDSFSKIADEVNVFGRRVMVIYGGGSVKKNGVYDRVIKSLDGFEVVEFGGVEPNPKVQTIRKAIDVAREFKPDLLLAVGGGSVIDSTKLISAGIYFDGDAWEIVENWVFPSKFVPLATVLTLSATGSEMNGSSVITNMATNEKKYFENHEVNPKFSILDPNVLASLPSEQRAYGIIDTFSHALEQYMHTTLHASVSDRLAEGIMLTLREIAHEVLKKSSDYEVMSDYMWTVTMALNNMICGVAEDWATHQIEHEVSAFYDIAHGAGLAILFPRWLEVVGKTQKRNKMIQFGKRVWGLGGTDDQIIDGAIQNTFDFFDSLGIPMKLSGWGIDNKHFDEMAERVAHSKVGEFALSKETVLEILNKSL